MVFGEYFGTYKMLTLPVTIDVQFPKLFHIDYNVLSVYVTQRHVSHKLRKILNGQSKCRTMVSFMIPRSQRVREAQVNLCRIESVYNRHCRTEEITNFIASVL